jgi:exopolysaccharide biosynthesis polyprenyl glycosylphosphotransferase
MRLRRRLLLVDLGAVALAAALSTGWLHGGGAIAWFAAQGLMVLATLAWAGEYTGAVRPRWTVETRRVIVAAAIVTTAAGVLRISLGAGIAADEEALTWLAYVGCVAAGRLLFRAAHATARGSGQGLCPTLIVGSGEIGSTVARRLSADVTAGLLPIGFLDEAPPDQSSASPERSLPVLGSMDDLVTVADRHGVRCVVVTFSATPDDRLVDLVRQCWALDLHVLVVPRLFELQRHRHDVHYLGRLPLQSLAPPPSRPWSLRAKDTLDRGVAAVAVVALSPLLITIAAAIRLTMGGPVLLGQVRVGRDGEPFEMLKFRTMQASPEGCGEADWAWAAASVGIHGQASLATPRCTRLGAFLRRTSLDELPQFLNIVRGDMSLIGPRPERVGYVRVFETSIRGYSDRHRMRTGLTGWAQVNGLRGDTSLRDRVEWDNDYIDNWSLWLDLRIACRTLPALLRCPADAARRQQADDARTPVAVAPHPDGGTAVRTVGG